MKSLDCVLLSPRTTILVLKPVPANSQITSLAARLREAIHRSGPMSFRDWMEAALYDERDGYYHRSDLTRWGRNGDYRTSPERTPLFATTFARYFAELYRQLGSPALFTIYEVGAGAGHFALGVLNALRQQYPVFYKATQYVIDERSQTSCRQVAALLEQHGHRARFVSGNAERLFIESGIVFANELLDALPVHRVRMLGGALREQFVDVNSAGEFAWCERSLSEPRIAETLARLGVVLLEGQLAEVNLAAEDWLKKTGEMLVNGFVITVDYGAETPELYDPVQRFGGTLRAIRQHKLIENVLAEPGEQDLTAHVNWTQLIQAGDRVGLHVLEFKRQDHFLLHAGLLDQLELLTREAQTAAAVAALRLDARELIMPDRMSAAFHVLTQEKRVTSDE